MATHWAAPPGSQPANHDVSERPCPFFAACSAATTAVVTDEVITTAGIAVSATRGTTRTAVGIRDGRNRRSRQWRAPTDSMSPACAAARATTLQAASVPSAVSRCAPRLAGSAPNRSARKASSAQIAARPFPPRLPLRLPLHLVEPRSSGRSTCSGGASPSASCSIGTSQEPGLTRTKRGSDVGRVVPAGSRRIQPRWLLR